MIINWEIFRESENELMGDRSRYINNHLEIEKMIKEEEYIATEIKYLNEIQKYNEEDNYNEFSDLYEYF